MKNINLQKISSMELAMYSEYEEPDCQAPCIVCDEKERSLDEVKYWMRFLLDQLYAEDALSVRDVERCLQEMCAVLGMKLPLEDINIQRSKEEPKSLEVPSVYQWAEWVQNNNKRLLEEIIG